ncbi:MAG: glycosyltransferase [Lachnospiraceae bacterium]|nr:glycosyltransferase [Lachnospiraceae bacterium]
MIKISVIVPVYNAERYIEQCIESILKQTMEEIEIVCVDDGSID